MLVDLKALTPDGLSFADPVLTNDDHAPGEAAGVMRGWLQADVVSQGQTAGGINIVLSPPANATEDRYTCPGNLTEPERCTVILDASGQIWGRRSVTRMGAVTVLEVVGRGLGGGRAYVPASTCA